MQAVPVAAPQNELPAAPSTKAPSAVSVESGSRAPGQQGGSDLAISVALEQIRTLDELKDAGYVTETEFEQIKRRILQDALQAITMS